MMSVLAIRQFPGEQQEQYLVGTVVVADTDTGRHSNPTSRYTGSDTKKNADNHLC